MCIRERERDGFVFRYKEGEYKVHKEEVDMTRYVLQNIILFQEAFPNQFDIILFLLPAHCINRLVAPEVNPSEKIRPTF